MDSKETSTDWRDAALNKLDGYCTRFNHGWNRGVAWIKGILPYLVVATVLLFLWDGIVSAGLHSWVVQHGPWVSFLNSHDDWAYVYGIGLFLVIPLFFAAGITYGGFRLARAMQRQRQKRASGAA
jgi:hypothetical protein